MGCAQLFPPHDSTDEDGRPALPDDLDELAQRFAPTFKDVSYEQRLIVYGQCIAISDWTESTAMGRLSEVLTVWEEINEMEPNTAFDDVLEQAVEDLNLTEDRSLDSVRGEVRELFRAIAEAARFGRTD